jgi:DNA-binding LytR/AlgR family response regulator
MINCVIIEDEPLAQTGLVNLIRPFSNLNVLQVCDDIPDFLQFQKNTIDTIDLLFMDIELPGRNAIGFLRESKPDIPVVLTTAYNQYAMDGYELNVLDYLLKPISRERFAQTVSKTEGYLSYLKARQGDRHDFMYVKSEKVIEKVYFNEIVLVEAMRNYVIYHCEKRKLICYNSLKNTEQSLPAEQFIKIQKSFIINKNKVQKIEKGFVTIHQKNIAINRGNKSEIIKRLMEQ